MVVSVNSYKLVVFYFLKLLESFVLSSHPCSHSLQVYSPSTFLYFHMINLGYMALNVRFDGEKALPFIFHCPFVTLSCANLPSGARVYTLPSSYSLSPWGFSNCTQKLHMPNNPELVLVFSFISYKRILFTSAIISPSLREITFCVQDEKLNSITQDIRSLMSTD